MSVFPAWTTTLSPTLYSPVTALISPVLISSTLPSVVGLITSSMAPLGKAISSACFNRLVALATSSFDSPLILRRRNLKRRRVSAGPKPKKGTKLNGSNSSPPITRAGKLISSNLSLTTACSSSPPNAPAKETSRSLGNFSSSSTSSPPPKAGISLPVTFSIADASASTPCSCGIVPNTPASTSLPPDSSTGSM